MDSDVITRSAVVLCGDSEKWFQIKIKRIKKASQSKFIEQKMPVYD